MVKREQYQFFVDGRIRSMTLTYMMNPLYPFEQIIGSHVLGYMLSYEKIRSKKTKTLDTNVYINQRLWQSRDTRQSPMESIIDIINFYTAPHLL